MYFESKKSGGEFNNVQLPKQKKKTVAINGFKENTKKFFKLKAAKTRGGNN